MEKADIPIFYRIDAEEGLSGVDIEFSVEEGQENGDRIAEAASNSPPPDPRPGAATAGTTRHRIQGEI